MVAVVFLLAILTSMTIPMSRAADTLSQPTVTIPSNWKLDSATPYPNSVAEHDPLGAGLIEYSNKDTFDFVMIYYEKSLQTFAASNLQAEAETIFQRDHSITMQNSGVDTYAGVSAGYAKGIDSDIVTLELVFIKGNYYFNVYAYYDNTAQAENQVKSVINSINVAGTSPLGLDTTMLIIIIGAVAAIIVVVVVVVIVARRRKKPQQSAQPAAQNNFPPPPPLAPTT